MRPFEAIAASDMQVTLSGDEKLNAVASQLASFSNHVTNTLLNKVSQVLESTIASVMTIPGHVVPALCYGAVTGLTDFWRGSCEP